MDSSTYKISQIILAGDYPRLSQKEIVQINFWLKRKFGSQFQCQNHREASRLIRKISAWAKQHRSDLQTYIDSEIWQGQKMDIFTFQRQILAKEFERTPERKKTHTLKKMLSDMLNLFCSPQYPPIVSAFERNKRRNFIASSKLEGIYLKDD